MFFMRALQLVGDGEELAAGFLAGITLVHPSLIASIQRLFWHHTIRSSAKGCTSSGGGVIGCWLVIGGWVSLTVEVVVTLGLVQQPAAVRQRLGAFAPW